MLKSYLAFDVETTGLNPETDEIIEIGALKVREGKVCERFISFVKPSEPVSERITQITGITNEMLLDAAPKERVIPAFLDFCGDEVLIEADGLSAFGRIQDFDLQIHKGEVVGFAGLLGSGRTETAELLAGVAKPEKGALRMNGREVHFNSPLDAMHHKIAFCPEDRKIQGIIGDLSVRENIIIGLQAKKGMWNHIPLKEQERIADEYIKLLQIKVSSPEQLIRNLSGGNQQKAIIARWLVTQPDLLILDEPTRGIDIGTKTEIQKMVIQLAREQHMSIIFISSEIDEMTRTCTRLAVLRDRRKVAELTGDDINSDRVMAAIAGGA